MNIKVNDVSVQLFESSLNDESIAQLLRFWSTDKAKLSYFESDELCVICLQKSPKKERGRYCLNDYDKGRLLYARQYLLDHVAIPPSIAELSIIAGINQFKLKNGFRELFNSSIYGYLNRFRLEKAILMIAQGEKNMTQIAFELGFSSLQHFSAAFKKYTVVRQKKLKLPPQNSEKSTRPEKNRYICCIIFPKQGIRKCFLTRRIALLCEKRVRKAKVWQDRRLPLCLT